MCLAVVLFGGDRLCGMVGFITSIQGSYLAFVCSQAVPCIQKECFFIPFLAKVVGIEKEHQLIYHCKLH